ncbi:hypothetical protein C7S13_6721 [Burkholderia cepacia]|nr:hypothetical protein [Burkholderia cepacia]
MLHACHAMASHCAAGAYGLSEMIRFPNRFGEAIAPRRKSSALCRTRMCNQRDCHASKDVCGNELKQSVTKRKSP